MKTRLSNFDVLIPNSKGELVHTVKIQISSRWDEEINEWVLTPGAHRLIDATKRYYMERDRQYLIDGKAYYDENRMKLIEQYGEGKQIVFGNGQFIGAFDTRKEGLEAGYKAVRTGKFFMQELLKVDKVAFIPTFFVQ